MAPQRTLTQYGCIVWRWALLALLGEGGKRRRTGGIKRGRLCDPSQRVLFCFCQSFSSEDSRTVKKKIAANFFSGEKGTLCSLFIQTIKFISWPAFGSPPQSPHIFSGYNSGGGAGGVFMTQCMLWERKQHRAFLDLVLNS